MTRADVDAVLPYLSDRPRSIVLSSMDVYSAYELAVSGRTGVAVPFDEDCPLRERRYPHRGERVDIDGYDHVDMDSYDKLVVESRCRSRAATVLRLGMVYGEDDPQRREEFVLRRVRAGRDRIPIGRGRWRWTRVHADDVARAVVAAVDTPAAEGQVFDIGETVTPTMREWVGQILDAAGHDADLVTVDDDRLPGGLGCDR